MNRNWVFDLLFLMVFVTSSVLRLGLAIVDRDSNNVIETILQQKRLPLTGECEECFQPKMYYFAEAAAIEIANINPDHQDSVTVAAQLINFIAGEIIILLAYILIKRLHADHEDGGLIAFALLSFNPALMAASGSTVNDTFAILFSSAAIYFCWEFMQEDKISFLIVSGLFVVFGLSTKTNTWSTALAIFLVLWIKGVKEKRFSGFVITATFMVAVFIGTLLNPLSQYLINLQKYGTPVTLNVAPEPLPSFFEKTYVRRPGIISIQDGLFTVKFIDLLESPRLTLGPTDYSPYRTSLWANLYGSANSLHFLNSPDSWHTKPDFEVTRSIFILALLPTVLFLFGVVSSWISLVKGFSSGSNDLLKQRHYGLFDLVILGYVLSIIALALRYRDFSTMKAIYIYPGVLAFVSLFLDGARKFDAFIAKKNKWIVILFGVAMVFLVVVYAIDVLHMIDHLYNVNIK